jgi:hypothetical protein
MKMMDTLDQSVVETSEEQMDALELSAIVASKKLIVLPETFRAPEMMIV